MKYLFLILFLPSLSFADCWVTSEIDQRGNLVIRPVDGFRPSSALQKCPLDDNGEVLKRGAFLKPVPKTVPDLSKPRPLTVPIETACDGAAQPLCADLMAQADFCAEGDKKLTGDRNEDLQLEVWCVHTGDQPTKQITVYEFDPDKKAAAIAARLAAKTIEDGKRTLRAQRRARFRTWCDGQTNLARDRCELILGR